MSQLTVFKYPLQLTDEQTILMPKFAEILCVQMQFGAPCLWVKVDRDLPSEKRTILIVGTGNAIPPSPNWDMRLNYIGTFQYNGGDLIFHVFEYVLNSQL